MKKTKWQEKTCKMWNNTLQAVPEELQVPRNLGRASWQHGSEYKRLKSTLSPPCQKRSHLESWWRWHCNRNKAQIRLSGWTRLMQTTKTPEKKQKTKQKLWTNDVHGKNNSYKQLQVQRTTRNTDINYCYFLKPSRHSLSWVLYVIHLGVSSGLWKQNDSVTINAA